MIEIDALNFTIEPIGHFVNQSMMLITDECRAWCYQQQYVFQHNEIIYLLLICFLGFFCFTMSHDIPNPKTLPLIWKGEEGQKIRERVSKGLYGMARFCMYLAIGYTIFQYYYGFLRVPI